MTGHELVMMVLCALPFVVIGWVGGMLFMRWQYKERLRQERRTNRRLERRMYGWN